MYNIGLQANTAIALGNGAVLEGWRESLIWLLGGAGHNAASFWDNLSFGAAYFLPIYAVTFIVGGFWEVLFATIRRHEVNEGFFVTSILFALILPPTIPLWQVALGISFGVVIGKEIFGGTGKTLSTLLWLVVPSYSLLTLHRCQATRYGQRPMVSTGATALSKISEFGLQNSDLTWLDAFWLYAGLYR